MCVHTAIPICTPPTDCTICRIFLIQVYNNNINCRHPFICIPIKCTTKTLGDKGKFVQTFRIRVVHSYLSHNIIFYYTRPLRFSTVQNSIFLNVQNNLCPRPSHSYSENVLSITDLC